MKKKHLLILCTILIIGIIIIASSLIIPRIKYNKATTLLSTSNYISSIKIFESIENYKDSKQLIEKAKNLHADELILTEEYDEAYDVLKSLGNDDVINKSVYERAIKLFEENNYEGARELFGYIKEYADSSEKIKEIEFNMIRNNLTSASIGDTIEFGMCEQDNNTENGSENIEWIVLDNENDKLFVLSKYCLGINYFDDSFAYTGVDIVKASIYAPMTVGDASSWESCSLSDYLNNIFFENAFNEAEKELIKPTLYHTNKNDEENLEIYNNIFLLSSEEARRYFKSNDSLKATPTAKAIADGLDEINGYSAWWLRDSSSAFAPYVDEYGDIDSARVNLKGGTRPAMWIKIPQ